MCVAMAVFSKMCSKLGHANQESLSQLLEYAKKATLKAQRARDVAISNSKLKSQVSPRMVHESSVFDLESIDF